MRERAAPASDTGSSTSSSRSGTSVKATLQKRRQSEWQDNSLPAETKGTEYGIGIDFHQAETKGIGDKKHNHLQAKNKAENKAKTKGTGIKDSGKQSNYLQGETGGKKQNQAKTKGGDKSKGIGVEFHQAETGKNRTRPRPRVRALASTSTRPRPAPRPRTRPRPRAPASRTARHRHRHRIPPGRDRHQGREQGLD